MNKSKNIFGILLVLLLPLLGLSQKHDYSIKINSDKIISTYDRSMLLGTNVGVFYEESYLLNFKMLEHLHQLNPGIIRMPGGTWSNELYWNGNKVRLSEESYIEKKIWDSTIKAGGNPISVAFDTSRYENGQWNVDYSGYAPGFRISDDKHHLSDYHGFTDVLFLHKFIQALGSETMVTVNLGTGTVEMAVEWVKWVKDRQKYAREPFNVKYWEMGNELDGDWELGHFLPDGSNMTAQEYIRRYKLFSTAMKKADPTIKVGGSVASSMQLVFIEELIKDTSCPIDFISFHAYPSNDNDTDFVTMAAEAVKVNDAVQRIKNWLNQYRPDQKEDIEIAVTEWNIKVKEDITTVSMLNALWSSVMIGEMAKAGVDIALQWDLFSTTPAGGHGLFNPKDPRMNPRSQYWAMYLWSKYMGNEMTDLTIDAPPYVKSYSTLENDTIAIMIINGSKQNDVSLSLNLPGVKHKLQAQEITFSKNQYQLDKTTLLPAISRKPASKPVTIQHKSDIDVPAGSIKIIRYNKN